MALLPSRCQFQAQQQVFIRLGFMKKMKMCDEWILILRWNNLPLRYKSFNLVNGTFLSKR